MARAPKILTKEDIQRAQKRTRSNLAASRYLHVSYPHYRKYALLFKNEDGVTLFEAHKNQEGKGIAKFNPNGLNEPPLLDILEGRVPLDHFDSKRIKERIIFEALIEEKCAHCGFSEKRVHDTKVPIILNHKDGNRKNWLVENLEFLCYNCAFLYATSPITENQIERMEDYVDKSDEEFDWEMDEATVQHLKDLGLYEEEKRPGDEYISRI